MTNDNLEKQKAVEFYVAGVMAWFNTRLEHDKSLLTLSAGGIGLLIGLLTTIGVSSAEGLVLHLLAMFSFLLCLGAILIIFKRNSDHIEDVLKADTQPFDDPLLVKLDNIAILAFAAGIVFSSVIGVSAAINSYSTHKEKTMANEKQKTGSTNRGCAADSVNGFSSLKPAGESNRSFNGLNNLKPAASQGSSTSTSGLSQPASPAATPVTNKK